MIPFRLAITDENVTRIGNSENQKMMPSIGTVLVKDVLFRLQFEEALGDTPVADKLAKITQSKNQHLLDGIDAFRAEVKSSYMELRDSDTVNVDLQKEMKELHLVSDALGQYVCCNNLRFSCLP